MGGNRRRNEKPNWFILRPPFGGNSVEYISLCPPQLRLGSHQSRPTQYRVFLPLGWIFERKIEFAELYVQWLTQNRLSKRTTKLPGFMSLRKSDSETDSQNFVLKLRTTPVSAAPTSVGIAPTKGAAGENINRTMSYPVPAVTAVGAAANSNPPRAVDSYPCGKLEGVFFFSEIQKPVSFSTEKENGLLEIGLRRRRRRVWLA